VQVEAADHHAVAAVAAAMLARHARRVRH
jgi:hypothetical protein